MVKQCGKTVQNKNTAEINENTKSKYNLFQCERLCHAVIESGADIAAGKTKLKLQAVALHARAQQTKRLEAAVKATRSR